MEVKFSKYEGAGNDFVLIDIRGADDYKFTGEQIADICHRRFGVGADGLMMLGDGGGDFDFSMRYFNSDGGESTMCGNGGRCITRFADDLGIGGFDKHFTAIDGAHRSTINSDLSITLSMIDIEHIERVEEGWLLNTGSPHLVIIDRTYDEEQARALRHKYNCNVNYINQLTNGAIPIRTFERGVEAETWACGTGATAAAVIASAHLLQMPSEKQKTIDLAARGGVLTVSFLADKNHFSQVTLRGEARKVFDGVLHI